MSSLAFPSPTTVAPRRGPVALPRSLSGSAVYWRRRAMVLTILLVLAFVLTAAISRVGAGVGAQVESQVAGNVVVEPGQTLWEVAAATAPEGVDTRAQVAEIRQLNGLASSELEPWSVLLLPDR